MLATLLFWFIMILTVASAVMVVVARNILHSAFSLAVTFLGVAGLYIFLHADFLAAVQLIVYVGGIIVLVMFAIMFSAHTQEGTVEPPRSILALGAGAIVAGVVFAALAMLINRLQVPFHETTPRAQWQKLEGRLYVLQGNPHAPGAADQIKSLSAEIAALKKQEAYRTTVSAKPGEYALGHVLLGEYLLPFEVASILILAALVGAVVIVRKETR
ncbi:MAG: NADH-quinone oxidoreductase subunit J [Planctomycetota bacterium]|nr:NADH-quinone oxidoreductase subunit J [Planctomycetota bacterium]